MTKLYWLLVCNGYVLKFWLLSVLIYSTHKLIVPVLSNRFYLQGTSGSRLISRWILSTVLAACFQLFQVGHLKQVSIEWVEFLDLVSLRSSQFAGLKWVGVVHGNAVRCFPWYHSTTAFLGYSCRHRFDVHIGHLSPRRSYLPLFSVRLDRHSRSGDLMRIQRIETLLDLIISINGRTMGV